jgi:hypothetical protein
MHRIALTAVKEGVTHITENDSPDLTAVTDVCDAVSTNDNGMFWAHVSF